MLILTQMLILIQMRFGQVRKRKVVPKGRDPPGSTELRTFEPEPIIIAFLDADNVVTDEADWQGKTTD